MNQLSSQIESLLFVASKPLTAKEIAKNLNQPEDSISAALDQLIAERQNTGVVILHNDSHYQMATNSQNSDIVKDFLNADLKESLTDATTEVLSIIAYKQPISKAEIEAIRGVNSQYSLRALLMRGLIEKIKNPSDARGPAYQVTTDFLQQLGITTLTQLPSFEEITKHVQAPNIIGSNDNNASPKSDEQNLDELQNTSDTTTTES
ncbi:MAG: SMC-Scp complex subunit ScpB [Candidatus Doudnabacteria bacterium]